MPLPDPTVADAAATRNFADLDKRIPIPGTYLKLDTQADRKIAFGSATVSWPGGSQSSDTETVSHGLGATPVTIQVTPELNSDATQAFPVLLNVGSSSFDVFLRTETGTPANTVTTTIYWMAIA